MKVPEFHPRPVEIEHHTPLHVHKPVHYTEKEYVPVVHEEHHHHDHGHHDLGGHQQEFQHHDSHHHGY